LKFSSPSDLIPLFNPSKSHSKRPYPAFELITLTLSEKAYINVELQLELQF
jgi:hypothetical protein